MSTKTIILILLGVAIAYAIGHIYLKGLMAGSQTATADAPTMVPTIEEIMRKGYNEAEAASILSALQAGTITTY